MADNIDSHELFAPVISACLVNAIYVRASQVESDQSFAKKVEDVTPEVLDLWTGITGTIKRTCQEHA